MHTYKNFFLMTLCFCSVFPGFPAPPHVDARDDVRHISVNANADTAIISSQPPEFLAEKEGEETNARQTTPLTEDDQVTSQIDAPQRKKGLLPWFWFGFGKKHTQEKGSAQVEVDPSQVGKKSQWKTFVRNLGMTLGAGLGVAGLAYLAQQYGQKNTLGHLRDGLRDWVYDALYREPQVSNVDTHLASADLSSFQETSPLLADFSPMHTFESNTCDAVSLSPNNTSPLPPQSTTDVHFSLYPMSGLKEGESPYAPFSSSILNDLSQEMPITDLRETSTTGEERALTFQDMWRDVCGVGHSAVQGLKFGMNTVLEPVRAVAEYAAPIARPALQAAQIFQTIGGLYCGFSGRCGNGSRWGSLQNALFGQPVSAEQPTMRIRMLPKTPKGNPSVISIGPNMAKLSV